MNEDVAIDWEKAAATLGVDFDTLPKTRSREDEPPAAAVAAKPPSAADGYMLTDEEWKLIRPHVPKSIGGRAKNNRGFLDGVIWRERMKGARLGWWYVPAECGVPVPSMSGRFRRWAEWGWWELFVAKLEGEALTERRMQDFRGIAREAAERREKLLAARKNE